MLNDMEKYSQLGELILVCLSGESSGGEIAQLREQLENDPYAMKYYSEYVMLYSALRQPGGVAEEKRKESFDASASVLGDVWQELAEVEAVAEEVIVRRKRRFWQRRRIPQLQEETQKRFIRKRKVAKLSRQFSRPAIHTAIISSAALLFIGLLVWLEPQQGPIVARVTSSVNAVWDEISGTQEAGSVVHLGKKKLFEGFVEFLMEGGAEVVVQGPAIVEMESEGQVYLHSGSLVSRVPPEAVGFVVRTPVATVIDYGTEFGVTAYPSGVTEAYVFEGVVEIRAGSDPVLHGDVIRLYAGQGGRVDAAGNVVVWNLEKQGERYVRQMPEDDVFASSGNRFDLADIIGGGNGFGSGVIGPGIDPLSGEIIAEFTQSFNRQSSGEYIAVAENDFVDGVVVPDGSNEQVVITSAGHVFEGCPDTDGMYWVEVTNDARVAVGSNEEGERRPVIFDGVEYGTMSKPAILTHANIGVTFDLMAIRKALPLQKLKAFTAACGISEPVSYSVMSDLRVFVDGQERFVWEGATVGAGLRDIRVELTDENRFLTLVATDGSDELGNGRDWAVFVEPAIELEAADDQFRVEEEKPIRWRIKNALKRVGNIGQDEENEK